MKAQENTTLQVQSESEQAGTLVFGQALSMIAQAVLPWIIIRLVSKVDVGAFSSLMLIYTTTAVILSSGFAPTLLYFNADRPIGSRKAVTTRIFLILVVLGAAAGLVLYSMALSVDVIVPLLEKYFSLVKTDTGDPGAVAATLEHLRLFSLYPLLDMPSRLIPNLLIAEKKPRGAAFFGIFRAIGTSVAAIIPAAMGLGVGGIVYGYLCLGIMQTCVVVIIIHGLYRTAPKLGNENVSVKRLFAFAVPIGLNDIVNVINTGFDSYLILFTMSAAVFAEYRMGAWQIPLVTSVAYSVGAVYMSRYVRLIKDNNPHEVMRLWRAAISRVSLLVVPVCLVFVVGAEEFVLLTLTPDYAAAAPIFRLYSLYTMGRVTSFGTVLVAADKSKYILWATLFLFGLNAAMGIPLLYSIGYIGPALGTTINFIPQVIVFSFLISKALGVSMRDTFPVVDYLKIVSLAIPSILAAMVPKYYLSHMPAAAFAAETLIILVGYSIVGTRAGYITKTDWDYLKNWMMGKLLFSKENKSKS